MSYIYPQAPSLLPGGLTFKQFLQQLLVGVSGLDGSLVRPKWQPNPPKQPNGDINWLAFAISQTDADTNAFLGVEPDGTNVFQRMEQIDLQCSFYGPGSYDIASGTRDGFQIPQNLEALYFAQMAFVNTSRMTHVPDLVNEKWIDRIEMTVTLRREVLRVYPILTFLSANGTIIANTDQGTKIVPWAVVQPQT